MAKEILKRNNIKTYEKKRPIEIESARKSQPEVTLNYLRLILHVQALCQIHRRIASGMRVENWIMEDGLVTRTDDRGNDPGEDVLEVKIENEERYLWVYLEKIKEDIYHN